ncbi:MULTISPECIES: hypothetical protein [Methylobacterium]|uniref:Uncharacterized protein n=2 Tax=Methylobacterium TaxID=407 RepID=A0A0C6FL57_9HYPH|nr:hypothetical protein [Methylobacterium aquaticum]QRE77161.1 hypothetical protein F1D61_29735 [Methylobacterium aquaticum]BAQ45889.1 hypothetical protein Maq22A_c13360 [Methylobacterium aquaticum]
MASPWGDEDDEPDTGPDVRVLRKGEHAARRGRFCTDCPRDGGIAPGERYRETVLLVDGQFVVDRRCLGSGCHDVPAAASRPPSPAWGPDEIPF